MQRRGAHLVGLQGKYVTGRNGVNQTFAESMNSAVIELSLWGQSSSPEGKSCETSLNLRIALVAKTGAPCPEAAGRLS